LVRHDKRKIPGVIDRFDGLLGSFHPPDLVRIESVAVVLIEDAITIKKYCRTLQISLAQVERIRAIFRQILLGFNISGGSTVRSLRRPSYAVSSLLFMRKLASFVDLILGRPSRTCPKHVKTRAIPAAKTSNNVAAKGLAFIRDWSVTESAGRQRRL